MKKLKNYKLYLLTAYIYFCFITIMVVLGNSIVGSGEWYYHAFQKIGNVYVNAWPYIVIPFAASWYLIDKSPKTQRNALVALGVFAVFCIVMSYS